jgi:hypothetical protein
MFSLAFVTTQEQVNALAPAIARKAGGDAIVWFAYPKGTSKKYKSHIDRDSGWNVPGNEGFEPVPHGGDRRGLVRQALPAGRIHQEHDTPQGVSTY